MPVVSTGEITIIDVLDGVDGLDGPALSIQASKAGFTFQDGVAVPATQAIAFTAARQSVSGDVVWSVSDGMTLDSDDGVLDITSLAFGIPGTGQGDTVYLDLSDFGSLRQASIAASVGGLTSFYSVLRIGDSTAAAGATRNVFVGNWATATSYFVGDVVLKDGYGWSCLQDHVSSGVVMPPTYPTNSNAYWTLYAVKGDQGVRGTITTSAATAGTAWVDAEANTAITAAGGVSPIAGDVVTLYNSAASFSQTRVRTSGGAWAALAAFFGGDVLVDGTLGANKLAANSVTANKIAAGAVTASKISVGDFAVQVRNWDFEEGDTQWTKEGTWAIALNAGQAKSGSYVATVTTTGGALRNSQYVATEPGETFYAEAYFKFAAGTTGSGASVRVQCTDSVGTEIIAGNGNNVVTSTTTYTKSSVQVTIPANAVRARIELVCGNLTAGTAYADEARMFRVSNATLIADGAITTAKLTANAVTADKIAANTITASRLLIADLSNAAPDADMSDSNSWSAPTAWETPPSASWRGSRVARLDGAASAYTVLSGKVFPVDAGAVLYFSYQGQVLAGAGAFGGQIQLSAATDMSTPSYITIPGQLSTSATLVTLTGTLTVPAGMKYARVQLYKNNDAATSVRVGGVIVRRAANAELIVDGAVSAAKIAAGAITTDKLLVTGRGKALNDDPTFQDASAWTLGGGAGSYALVTESTSPVGTKVLRATNDVQFRARSFPITAGTRYKVTMWAQQTSGTGVMYLRLYCYNAASTLINYVATTVSPGSGTLEGIDVPATWTKYIGYVDAGAATVTGQLIVHVNWGGGGGVTDIADCRVEEYIGADLIVDGAITAGKLAANSIAVGTAAIQNGAIVNAMIGNATITDAKIADLSATKITAGTLDAARIAAGSITADKIKVSSRGGLTLLSDDPLFQDSTLWTVLQGNINFSTGTTASGAKGTTYIVSNDGTDRIIQSARFYEIDPNETYRLTALLYRDPTSNRNMYLFVEFYDYNLAYVTGATTGWGGSKSGYVYGAVPPTANVFQRLGGNFGPNTGRTIPSTVRYCKIGAWFNYSGNGTTTATQAFQDLRLDQVVNGGQLIVDGTITATQIDSRGLSIRDASNNIILAAGSPLAASNITPAAGWLNSNVGLTESTGTISLTGAGSGSVTTITANNKLTSGNVSTYIASAAITNAYIGGTIQSDDYVAGTTGWAIAKSGSAEFNTGTFRGALSAATGSFAGSLSAATGTFAGSLSAAGGTFAGTLTAAAVNAVNTINIAGQAVTIPVAAYTTTQVSLTTTLTAYQSCAITSSGAPITVIAGAVLSVACVINASSYTIAIKRGATTVYSYTIALNPGEPFKGPFNIPPFQDTPGAGSQTYTLNAQLAAGGFISGTIEQRSLVLLETKK